MARLSKEFLMKISLNADKYDPDYKYAMHDENTKVKIVNQNNRQVLKVSTGEKREYNFSISDWLIGGKLAIKANENFNMVNTATYTLKEEELKKTTWSKKELKAEREKIEEYEKQVNEYRKQNGGNGVPQYDSKRPNLESNPIDIEKLSKEEINERELDRIKLHNKTKKENAAARIGLYVAGRRIFDGKPTWKKLLSPFSSIRALYNLHKLKNEILEKYDLKSDQIDKITSFVNDIDEHKYEGFVEMNNKGNVISKTVQLDEQEPIEETKVTMESQTMHEFEHDIYHNQELTNERTNSAEDNEIFQEELYERFNTNDHKKILHEIEHPGEELDESLEPEELY